MRKHQFTLESVTLSTASLTGFDTIILATDHDAFDYPLIESNSQLLIDTRGKFIPNSKIIRA